MNWLQKIGSKLVGKKALYGGGFVYVNKGKVVWIADNTAAYITEGYTSNDIVYSAVNLVMDKVRCAPWGLYKIVDESSLKRYNGLINSKTTTISYTEAVKLRKKAIEPLTNIGKYGRLNDLLKWPNEEKTFQDMVANSVGEEMITGNSFWYFDKIPEGANEGKPGIIWELPSQYTSVVVTKTYPHRIVGYQLTSGENRSFEKEEVLHFKHPFNPCYDYNGSHLYGLSPLKAASKVVKRSNSAKEASVMAFENGGAVGIVYVDDDRLSPEVANEQAKLIRDKWNREYTGKENFNKIAVSGVKAGYAKITDTLVDMNLVSVEDLDLRRLCNIWGIPSQILNDPENKVYANTVEGEKALTSRCVLSKLSSRRERINQYIQTVGGYVGENIYIDYDMSVYTELQENSADKLKWVERLPVPLGYKLDMMGLDHPETMTEEELNLVIVPSGFQLLGDLMGGDEVEEEELLRVEEELNKADLNYLKIAK